MPRLPRYRLADQPQHVIQRGNNRMAMFAAPDDYVCFRDCLALACARYGCALHAYVLMTNHVHLLLTPRTADAISRVMQSVGRRYVHHFNTRYGRTGTLWEGRYRATLVDDEAYLLRCHRYIELNPVRGGLVSRPSLYPWSSHRANAFGSPDALLEPHPRYLALGDSTASRLSAYRALFRRDLDEAQLREIRSATNNGWALAGSRFCAAIATRVDRRMTPLRRRAPRVLAGV